MTEQGHDDSGSSRPTLKLTITEDGEEWVREFRGGAEITIGRADDCDITLGTGRASRRHARIVLEGDQYHIVDEGSSNGTLLNGIRVTRQVLFPGDVLGIGESRIVCGERPAASPVPPAPGPTGVAAVGARPALAAASERRTSWSFYGRFLVLVWCALAVGAIVWIGQEVLRLTDFDEVVAPAVPAGSVTPPVAPVWPSAASDTSDVDVVGRESPEPVVVESREPPVESDEMPGSEELHGSETRQRADAQVDALLRTRAFGEAAAVARALAALVGTDVLAEHWNRRLAEVEAAAGRDLEVVETRIEKLTGAGKPRELLEALIDLGARHGEGSAGAALVRRHLESRFEERIVGLDASLSSPGAAALRGRLAVAIESCRFREAAMIYRDLLALGLGRSERIELLQGLVEVNSMERMFREFLERVAEKILPVSVFQGEKGRIVGADEVKVSFELDIEGREYVHKDSIAWRRLTVLKKCELFTTVRLSPAALVGVVAYCFRFGHDDGAHAALIRLGKAKEFSGLADTVLALHLGVAVPDGGFVEYRDRLVDPEFRAREIARRKSLDTEAESARRDLARLQRDSGLAGSIALAKRYRGAGRFELAHSILVSVARRFPETVPGAEATRLIADPLLAVRPLAVTGPVDNRLDFYFLSEAYTLDDDHQEAFVGRARAALAVLLNQEPYREFRSYLNFHIVNVASRDSGVDREPGDIERDTALGGKVAWDKFTVERSRVEGILARVGDGGRDRQAIVIGNDFAGVPTASRGIVCLSKVSVAPLGHEIGHALAELHDEYDFELGMDPQRKVGDARDPDEAALVLTRNLVAGSRRHDVLAKVPWRHWIDAGLQAWWNGMEVSIFEGGGYRRFNRWRPQATCKMRSATTRFCVVCMEAMVTRIYAHVRPIERVEPEGDKILLGGDETVEVKVWPLKPETHFLDTRWRLVALPGTHTGVTAVVRDPRSVRLTRVLRRIEATGRPVEVAVVDATRLDPGTYRLEVTVRDTTPWVLKDEEKRLIQTRRWTIVVEANEH